MKRLILASAVFMVTLLLFTGCFNPLQSIPDGLDSDNDTSTQTGGTVRVSIPPYAPWLDSLMSEPTGTTDGFNSRAITDTGSRAFLVADRVVLTVFDSGSAQIAQETFDPAAFYFDEAGDGTVGHALTLPAGTGYTIQAEIYNLDESTENPMVSGTSDPFAVTDGGETPVAITCIPVNPAELVLDTPQTFTQVSTTMDEATGEPSSLGGETWVSAVVPSNGIVWINVDMPDTGYFMAMALYDGQGTAYPGGYGMQSEPLDDETYMMTGDGYVYFYGANPGDTIYIVFILVGDGISQDFTLTRADDFYTIRGTVTVPGITDESLLPELSGEFLAPAFNSSMEDWIVEGNMIGGYRVSGENLLFDYFFFYDGDETAVLGAGIANGFSWPQVQPGDWVGAWDGDTETPMDFVAGTGIEPYHFTGNVTDIDFTMQLIESTPVPASAFPDEALRAAMEGIIGKSFTGVAGGVTDADLLALNTIDLNGRGEVYSDLTGLELCDNTYGLFLSENNLSGCDLGTGPGGSAYEILSGMDSLHTLMLWDCGLDHLDFITGVANLGALNVSGNTSLSYAEQSLIDPANFPNLGHLWYSGNSSTPVNDTEWAALVEKLSGFTELYSLGMVGFGITPGQFDTFYTDVLSTDPGAFTELDFGQCSLDNSSLTSLANLTALEYLNLCDNSTVNDISSLATANLSSLQFIDIVSTSVTDLTPLETLHGLGGFSTHSHWGNDVNVAYLGLDLWPGTANRDVIDYLIGQGVDVLYEDGNNLVAPAGSGSLEVTVY